MSLATEQGEEEEDEEEAEAAEIFVDMDSDDLPGRHESSQCSQPEVSLWIVRCMTGHDLPT